MKRKTPQEKKRESYLRDRRNTYGENSKSSRRNIARNKRIRSRVERRLVGTAFVRGVGLDVDWMDDVESRVVLKRRRAWTKSPDEPLGKVVKEKLRYRVELGMLDAAGAAARTARIHTVTQRDI